MSSETLSGIKVKRIIKNIQFKNVKIHNFVLTVNILPKYSKNKQLIKQYNPFYPKNCNNAAIIVLTCFTVESNGSVLNGLNVESNL